MKLMKRIKKDLLDAFFVSFNIHYQRKTENIQWFKILLTNVQQP